MLIFFKNTAETVQLFIHRICSPSSPLQVVSVLRSLLTQLDETKKERETLEVEIKSATFDMSITFLTALAQAGTINEEQLSLSQLEQLYGSYKDRVKDSLDAQEMLLGQVQVRVDKNH